MKRILIVSLMLVSFVGSALADHVVTMESRDPSDPENTTEILVFMTPDNLKMLNKGEASAVIYKSKEETIYMVDDSQKQFTVMDKESIEQIGAQMGDAMKQMEEALAQMPEEQREMARNMMKGKMPAASAATPRPKPEIKKTGEKKTISGKPCHRYDVTKDGVKTTEIWATSWDESDVSKEDFEIFTKMTHFMQDIMSANEFFANSMAQNEFFVGLEEIDGFPILTRDFKDGEVTDETVLKSVEKKSLAPSVFTVPEGYERSDPMSGMRER